MRHAPKPSLFGSEQKTNRHRDTKHTRDVCNLNQNHVRLQEIKMPPKMATFGALRTKGVGPFYWLHCG